MMSPMRGTPWATRWTKGSLMGSLYISYHIITRCITFFVIFAGMRRSRAKNDARVHTSQRTLMGLFLYALNREGPDEEATEHAIKAVQYSPHNRRTEERGDTSRYRCPRVMQASRTTADSNSHGIHKRSCPELESLIVRRRPSASQNCPSGEIKHSTAPEARPTTGYTHPNFISSRHACARLYNSAWEYPPSRGRVTDAREKESPLPVYDSKVEG
ncbi:hypothetical protein CRG98_011616 [Punica granatum]|uniref:Uncharacterized protein n=1 Tax=Punica granatum TaxID=22663 RepID=A0A2I0KI89_PUNGR|nr:hypothetical protein CRG98_011616 [Punica granatum]